MLEITKIVFGVYLTILAVIDIRVRRVPTWTLIAGGMVALVVRVFQYGGLDILAAGGAAIGGGFIVVSKITREGFGYGDSFLIFVLGLYLGFWDVMAVLLGAFVLSALFAVGLLVRKGFDKKAGLPFIPFLFLSYIIWLCTGGVL